MNIYTGEVRDTMENGQHMAAVEYASLLDSSIQEIGFAIAGFGQGFAAYTFGFLGSFLGMTPITDLSAALAAAKADAQSLTDEIKESLSEGEGDGDVGKWVSAFINGVETLNIQVSIPGVTLEIDFPNIGGFCNGVSYASSVIGSHDPPILTGYVAPAPDRPQPVESATAVVSAAANLPAGAISSDVNTALVGVVDGSSQWTTAASNSFAFDSLAVGSATVYQNGAVFAVAQFRPNRAMQPHAAASPSTTPTAALTHSTAQQQPASAAPASTIATALA